MQVQSFLHLTTVNQIQLAPYPAHTNPLANQITQQLKRALVIHFKNV